MQIKTKFILLLSLFGIMLILIVFSRYIFPNSLTIDLSNMLQPPGLSFPFGTDFLGRDMLHRTFGGLKTSLALALIIQILSLLIGAVIGLLAGYFRGIVDKVFLITQNVLMAFPNIIASVCMITLLGPGMWTLIIALSVMQWVGYAKLVRSDVIVIKERDFITGARAVGAPTLYLLFRHIFPNIVRPVIPFFTLMIGHTVITISGLGFLGFGVNPPTPEIGLMISESIPFITMAPWLFILPGLTLGFYILILNVLADTLRDMLDPHAQSSIL